MADSAPMHDRILAAAETVLRRHGVEKANVVDIAKILKVSHAAIYKHFPSKKALMDAVAAHWLDNPARGDCERCDEIANRPLGRVVRNSPARQATQSAR